MAKRILHEERINGSGTGKYRELTEEEKANIKQKQALLAKNKKKSEILEKQRQELLANCTHEFFYDTPGFLYDVRHCVVCSHTELI